MVRHMRLQTQQKATLFNALLCKRAFISHLLPLTDKFFRTDRPSLRLIPTLKY